MEYYLKEWYSTTEVPHLHSEALQLLYHISGKRDRRRQVAKEIRDASISAKLRGKLQHVYKKPSLTSSSTLFTLDPKSNIVVLLHTVKIFKAPSMSAASTMTLFTNRQTGNQDSAENQNSPEEELPPLSSLFKGALGCMPESEAGDPSTEHSLHVKAVEESSSTVGFDNNKVMKRKRSISPDPTRRRETLSLELGTIMENSKGNNDHSFPEKPTEECSKRSKLNSPSQEDSGVSTACESSSSTKPQCYLKPMVWVPSGMDWYIDEIGDEMITIDEVIHRQIKWSRTYVPVKWIIEAKNIPMQKPKDGEYWNIRKLGNKVAYVDGKLCRSVTWYPTLEPEENIVDTEYVSAEEKA
ncbi:hypothetical protein F5884DRAFT_890463 [Xylogone sp. PMI_703]|nr:hypothetical protein F5884DRAFT_890463 [Xylogone sp. PMI_703]